MRIVEAREIGFFQNGGSKARFGEDHDAGSALQQMCAGARAYDQKEGVLHFAVQPDDTSESAKYFALAALLQDRCRAAAECGGRRGLRGHAITCDCRRAMRSFHRNWPALMT